MAHLVRPINLCWAGRLLNEQICPAHVYSGSFYYNLESTQDKLFVTLCQVVVKNMSTWMYYHRHLQSLWVIAIGTDILFSFPLMPHYQASSINLIHNSMAAERFVPTCSIIISWLLSETFMSLPINFWQCYLWKVKQLHNSYGYKIREET